MKLGQPWEQVVDARSEPPAAVWLSQDVTGSVRFGT